MLNTLHWLPVQQWIEYRVFSLVWQCQLRLAPAYLTDLCQPMLGSGGSHSVERGSGGMFACIAPIQNRAFSAVNSRVWNSFPQELRLSRTSRANTFYGRPIRKPTFLSGLGLVVLLRCYLEAVLYTFFNKWMTEKVCVRLTLIWFRKIASRYMLLKQSEFPFYLNLMLKIALETEL